MASLKDLIAKKKEQGEAPAQAAPTSSVQTAQFIKNKLDQAFIVESPISAEVPKKGLFINLKKGADNANVNNMVGSQPEMPSVREAAVPNVGAKRTTASQADDFNHPGMIEKFEIGDVDAFKQAISILHNSLEHPELVGNATRNILLSLRENPEFTKILAPQDFQAMIRGLRESHGITVASKVMNKTKRAKNQKDVDDLAEMIGDIDFNVGGAS